VSALTQSPPVAYARPNRSGVGRRALAAGLLALGLVGAVSWAAEVRFAPARFAPARFAPATPPGAELSLLAVGDTGKPPSWLPVADAQVRVGHAMARAHTADPVDVIVLLGDNFYPKGLRSREAVARIRANVVRPYCPFVALRGPRSAEVADACPPAGVTGGPVPILAVLGNHDHDAEESPGLERNTVPAFVSNWSTPAGMAGVHELRGGVSLVLVQSEELLAAADAAPLRDALRQARGPWRIVAVHRPAVEGVDGPTHDDAHTAAFSKRVQDAVAESGVEVQLLLAGHEHNLQIFEGSRPGPDLVVVAGGGAGHRPTKFHARSRRFTLVRMGFARIDLVGTGEGTRLVASLLALRDVWIPGFDSAELVARWSVSLAGDVRDELPAAAQAR